MFDTGTSTGNITGHSRTLNAVSVRRQRPFGAATGSDDFTVGLHHGKARSVSGAELGSEG